MNEKQPKKRSTVRHTRAIQRDRRTRPTVAPSAPQVEARLAELIHPATLAQVATFQRLGLLQRVLLDVLPRMETRWQDRQRPVPPVLARAQRRFSAVLALDGSTLDVLLRQVGLLREVE